MTVGQRNKEIDWNRKNCVADIDTPIRLVKKQKNMNSFIKQNFAK